MLSYAQALILGLLQGFTELFPVSSLGHAALVPALLGWSVDETSPQFLAFTVATHLATALVLLGFFFVEWVAIIGGVLRSLFTFTLKSEDTAARVGWRIAVSSIPAGILGLLLQKHIEHLFASSALIAGVLIANGLVLYLAEYLRTKAKEGAADDTKLAGLSFRQSFGIGLLQALALIPGFSRTGMAMTGGLVSGLSHENAAQYAFLLATPLIVAASLLEIPKLFVHAGGLSVALVGALAAAGAAYASIRFLTKYFETKTLSPFAAYCVAAGICSFALLIL